jgi:hypothetical protein
MDRAPRLGLHYASRQPSIFWGKQVYHCSIEEIIICFRVSRHLCDFKLCDLGCHNQCTYGYPTHLNRQQNRLSFSQIRIWARLFLFLVEIFIWSHIFLRITDNRLPLNAARVSLRADHTELYLLRTPDLHINKSSPKLSVCTDSQHFIAFDFLTMFSSTWSLYLPSSVGQHCEYQVTRLQALKQITKAVGLSSQLWRIKSMMKYWYS